MRFPDLKYGRHGQRGADNGEQSQDNDMLRWVSGGKTEKHSRKGWVQGQRGVHIPGTLRHSGLLL